MATNEYAGSGRGSSEMGQLWPIASEGAVRAVHRTSTLEAASAVFDELCSVLGLLAEDKTGNLDAEIEALIEKRQQARKCRDFTAADTTRDELKKRGIVLEDTPQGVKWSYVQNK